jgi:hypothetical protein
VVVRDQLGRARIARREQRGDAAMQFGAARQRQTFVSGFLDQRMVERAGGPGRVGDVEHQPGGAQPVERRVERRRR